MMECYICDGRWRDVPPGGAFPVCRTHFLYTMMNTPSPPKVDVAAWEIE